MSTPTIPSIYTRQKRGKGETVEIVEETQNPREIKREETGTTPMRSEMERAVAEYEAAVDDDMVRFIEGVRSVPKEFRDKLDYTVSEISERQRADIERLVGETLSAKRNVIAGNEVDHIYARHGTDGKQDSSMADIFDIARVKYILDNYDDVGFATRNGKIIKSNKFKTAHNEPSPVMLFVKKVNGFYMVAEAINDSGRGNLNILSAYKNKGNPLRNNVAQEPLAVVMQSQPRRRTSETHPAHIHKIPQSPEKVNTEDKKNDEAGSELPPAHLGR